VAPSGGAGQGRSAEAFVPQVGSRAARCSPRRGELPGGLPGGCRTGMWLAAAATSPLTPRGRALLLWKAVTKRGEHVSRSADDDVIRAHSHPRRLDCGRREVSDVSSSHRGRRW